MKNKFTKLSLVIIFLFFSGFIFCNASSSGIDVNLNVGGCNNNGVCEKGEEDILSCPLDCTPPPPESSVIGSIPVSDYYFNNLTVEVSYDSATIKWKSTVPTMSSIMWGTNPDYKDGVLRNINFLLNHSVLITGLKDGTDYFFSIQAESLLRKTNTLDGQNFRTLTLPDRTPPANPTNIITESNKVGITIKWENPSDLDFDYIRVLRNDKDIKKINPYSGKIVYEGRGQYFTDGKVVLDKEYFYSLFSRDRTGNYSSGVLVGAIYKIPTSDGGESSFGEVTTPIIRDDGSPVIEGRGIFGCIQITWVTIIILWIIILIIVILFFILIRWVLPKILRKKIKDEEVKG